jgi:short-subunit dehydrogenase
MKRALLTGASSGIGVAAARRLAEAGYDLALIARGDGLAVAEDEAAAAGAKVLTLRADVADHEQLARAVDEAATGLGGLDLAVLNAGVGTWGRFTELDRDDFNRVLDVTFRATVDATRLVLPHLERSNGRIVYTSSVAGQMPVPMMSPYCAAKHALRGFAGALRAELKASGSPVTIGLVSPGPVDTPFWQHAATPAGRPESSAPPLTAYDAETVAIEILRVAEGNQREVTVGGATALLRALYAIGGGVAERALGEVMVRVAGERDDSPRKPGALDTAAGDGLTGGGRFGRPGILALGHDFARRLRSGASGGT